MTREQIIAMHESAAELLHAERVFAGFDPNVLAFLLAPCDLERLRALSGQSAPFLTRHQLAAAAARRLHFPLLRAELLTIQHRPGTTDSEP